MTTVNDVVNQKSKAELAEEQKILEAYHKHAGNVTAVVRELPHVTRYAVLKIVEENELHKKPIAGGRRGGTDEEERKLPSKGEVKRYIVTSAQNNTKIHAKFFDNLLAMSEHYDAEVLIGTFSYNQNNYGQLAVKAGTKKEYEKKLWFDQAILPYICDKRVRLAPGLVWCGEMNIMPTAEDPLSGLETYSHARSAIFPHTKLAMRSIANTQDESAKLIYTTGAVTLMNYIKKKAGLKAEHHHRYAFLLVEVDSDGNWWVRQVASRKNGNKIQDLNVVVEDGAVTSQNARVEAISWGDIHGTIADEKCVELSLDMKKVLRPRVQFLHDVMEGCVTNHHTFKDCHQQFKNYTRGYSTLVAELLKTMEILSLYAEGNIETVIVESNHDSPWILRWLREYDYRKDPANALFFLRTQLAVYRAIEVGDETFSPLEWVFKQLGFEKATFLLADQSYKICNNEIECGMHGHLGANGAAGTPKGLSKLGHKATTEHTHSAGIWDGLYVGGTTAKLKMGYNKGLSSWSHSHVLAYPTGERAIVTMRGDKWRA